MTSILLRTAGLTECFKLCNRLRKTGLLGIVTSNSRTQWQKDSSQLGKLSQRLSQKPRLRHIFQKVKFSPELFRGEVEMRNRFTRHLLRKEEKV